MFSLGGEVGVRCSPRPKPPAGAQPTAARGHSTSTAFGAVLLHWIPFLHRAGDALLLPALLPFLSHRSATECLHSRLHSCGIGCVPTPWVTFGTRQHSQLPSCKVLPSPSWDQSVQLQQRLICFPSTPSPAPPRPHSTFPQCWSTALPPSPPPAIHVLVGNVQLSAPPTTNTWPRTAFPSPSAPSASPTSALFGIFGSEMRFFPRSSKSRCQP